MSEIPDDPTEVDWDRLCWIQAHQLADFEHRVRLDNRRVVKSVQAHNEAKANDALDTLEQYYVEGIDVVSRTERFLETMDDSNLRPIWLEDRKEQMEYDPEDIHLRNLSDDDRYASFTTVPEGHRYDE